MGIINSTPDSFYAESRKASIQNILSTTEEMINDGADIIDIGGYSSRPGAQHISTEEEIDRVIPSIKAIKSTFPDTIVSIDTFRSEVANAAILAGADMINDISGGISDPDIFNIAANHKAPVCIMHMRGTPQNMQSQTQYDYLLSDLILFFSRQVNLAKNAGVNDIIIDPGFGFSKTTDQNYELLNSLKQLKIINLPLLVGISRKSMLYKFLEIVPEEALNATTTANVIALINGANILRVHDVKPAKEAIQILSKTLYS